MKQPSVMIYAKNVATMTAFYRDVLQLPIVKQAADWAELDAGGFVLALHAIPAPIAAGIEVMRPPRPRQNTPLKIGFVTDDLKAARERLRKADAEMPSPGSENKEPERIDGLDPEGNIFTIWRRS